MARQINVFTGPSRFKTINGQSIIGTGNIDVSGGGGGITVDSALSLVSTNPVQNRVITQNLNTKVGVLTNAPSQNNASGKFDVVLLNSQPLNFYTGYLYVIDTGSNPSEILNNTIILGDEEDINGNVLELGADANINGNVINF